jgi:hypothetical protein
VERTRERRRKEEQRAKRCCFQVQVHAQVEALFV